MRRFPLLIVLPLAACAEAEEVLERLQVEGPFGAVFDFDPASLPEGIDPADVRLEEFDLPAELPAGIEEALSASLVLLPEGIELSAPATLVVPVGSWTGLSGRDDPFDPQGGITTSANVAVLGQAPALAMGNLYSALAMTTGLAFQNAVLSQRSLQATMTAITSQTVAELMGYSQQATSASAVYGATEAAWNTFASNPAGNAALQAASILPVGSNQSTASAAAGAGVSGRDGEIEYATFEWVETSDGVWDTRVTTRFFESYTLVKLHVDADGNGIHDVMEGPDDLDGDAVWSPEDWDNDGDRIADEFEAWEDTDGDGLPAMNDPDRDGVDPADGIAECGLAGDCACAYRDGGHRFVCAEGDDLSCQDGDFGWGPVEYEIVPLACPDPGEGEGATCEGAGGIAVHYYGTAKDVAYWAFCQECVPGTESPALFCPPPEQ
jgi:hypothetical protein